MVVGQCDESNQQMLL